MQQIKAAADFEKSYQRVDKVGLKNSTEALITAAQHMRDLSMRSKEARIYHTWQKSWCTCDTKMYPWDNPAHTNSVTDTSRQGTHGAPHSSDRQSDNLWILTYEHKFYLPVIIRK